MTDGDFKVPPAARREAKQFEPPPWERDAFDDLAQRREQQEAAEREAAARAQAEREAAERAAAEEAALPVAAATTVDAADANAEVVAVLGTEAPSEAPVNESAVLEMLAGLSAEEPRPHRKYWKITVGLGGAMVLLGAVVFIWGMAGAMGSTRTGRMGLTAGMILMAIGGLFVGAGMWVVVGNLKKQGVI